MKFQISNFKSQILFPLSVLVCLCARPAEARPGVVLDKMVLNTGGLRPSYLGPPETRVNAKQH